MNELPAGGSGGLAAGGTGPLQLPRHGTGTGPLGPMSAPAILRAYSNDRSSTQGVGDAGFSPSQMDFATARQRAAQAGGIGLLARVADAPPEQWPALLRGSSAEEMRQAAAFLAGQPPRRGVQVGALLASGPDPDELDELLDDLDRRLDALHGGRQQPEGSPDDPDEE